MSASITTKDLSTGIYRRIYSARLTDKKLNNLSMPAELTLDHIKLLADDFGNLHGDIDLLLIQAYPRRRDIKDEDFASWIQDLIDADYLARYEAAGDEYLHIHGWLDDQPAGKNGRRVMRFPASPWCVFPRGDETEGPLGNPGESKLSQEIQDNPKESNADHDQDHDQDQLQEQDHDQDQGQTHPAESKITGSGNFSSDAGGVRSGQVGNLAGNMLKQMDATQAEARAHKLTNDTRVREALRALGINEVETLKSIVGKPGLTPSHVEQVVADVKADPTADGLIGPVVWRLRNGNVRDGRWVVPRKRKATKYGRASNE